MQYTEQCKKYTTCKSAAVVIVKSLIFTLPRGKFPPLFLQCMCVLHVVTECARKYSFAVLYISQYYFEFSEGKQPCLLFILTISNSRGQGSVPISLCIQNVYTYHTEKTLEYRTPFIVSGSRCVPNSYRESMCGHALWVPCQLSITNHIGCKQQLVECLSHINSIHSYVIHKHKKKTLKLKK